MNETWLSTMMEIHIPAVWIGKIEDLIRRNDLPKNASNASGHGDDD